MTDDADQPEHPGTVPLDDARRLALHRLERDPALAPRAFDLVAMAGTSAQLVWLATAPAGDVQAWLADLDQPSMARVLAHAGADLCRPAERIGPVRLSVQASWAHGCTPRVGTAADPLDGYDTVEVAIIHDRHHFVTPDQIGLPQWQGLWAEGQDVAANVPIGLVPAIRADLLAWAERQRGQTDGTN